MKRIIFGIIIGMLAVSTYNSESNQTESKQTGRVFEDARTEDGKIDLALVIASNKFPQERIEAFKFADGDSDGFLTEEVYNNIPKTSEFEFIRRSHMATADSYRQAIGQRLRGNRPTSEKFGILGNDSFEEESSWLADIDEFITMVDQAWINSEQYEKGDDDQFFEASDTVDGSKWFECEMKNNFNPWNQPSSFPNEWSPQQGDNQSKDPFHFTFRSEIRHQNTFSYNNLHIIS